MEYLKLNIQLFGVFAEKENTSLVSKSGPNKGRVYAKFSEANATADDISKNQTRITPYGEYSQGGSYSGYNTPKLVLTWYDDNEHKNGLLLGTTPATSYANKEKIKVEPKEFAVKHKDDGTLNGYLKAEWIWTGSGYCCNSGSAVTSNTALTSIPRAKTISALSADIGYDTLITLKQTSASYTTTITYECGELSGTIEEKTSETSIGWKIPTEIYSQLLPTDKEIDVKLTATTYSGDTQIGSAQTTTFKARVNEEDNRPIAYLDVEDVNEITTSLTDDPNKVVLNASSMLCNVQGMSKNGATIQSMKINDIELVDFNYRQPDEGTPEDITEIALDEFTIEKPTTNTFTLTVTDSRGFTNTITSENQKTLEKIDYIIPTISAIFKRNTPVDGLVNVRYDGKFFNGSFKEDTPNILQMAYQYKEKGTGEDEYSQWIELTPQVSETDNTYGGQLQLEELFNYEQQFDFRLSVKDLVNDYGVVFTTGSIAKGKPSHWYDDENFYVEGSYYQRDKESGKWKKFKSGGELPIGSIYSNTVNPANPKDLLGYGEWKNISGVALIGAGTYTDSAGTEQTFNAGDVVGTYTHRHTEAAHTHVLNANGWAKIYFGSSNFIAKDKSTGNWTSNAKKTVSGTNNTASATGSYGVELGGVTGAKSATTYTTYTSTIQPSRVVYMWERIA